MYRRTAPAQEHYDSVAQVVKTYGVELHGKKALDLKQFLFSCMVCISLKTCKLCVCFQ